jgi:heme/copper-type cytochrome/quinol oxidase subunit 1
MLLACMLMVWHALSAGLWFWHGCVLCAQLAHKWQQQPGYSHCCSSHHCAVIFVLHVMGLQASRRRSTRPAAAGESDQPLTVKVTEALGSTVATSGQAIQVFDDWLKGLLATGWCTASSATLAACIGVFRATGGQEINAAGKHCSTPPGCVRCLTGA